MELSEAVKEQLIEEIKQAKKSGQEFPIKTTSEGGFQHQIYAVHPEKEMLITVIEIEGEKYFVYLV